MPRSGVVAGRWETRPMHHQNWNARRVLAGPVAAVALGALLAACGSTPPPPVDAVAAAQTAVTSAEQANAATLAPAELDRARDKLLRAQAAIQQEDNVEARRLAEQASVDARLAETRARATLANRNAEEFQAGLDAVRAEGAATPTAGGATPRPLGAGQ